MSPPTLLIAPSVLLRRAISVDTLQHRLGSASTAHRLSAAAQAAAGARAPAGVAPAGVPVPAALLRALSASAASDTLEPELSLR